MHYGVRNMTLFTALYVGNYRVIIASANNRHEYLNCTVGPKLAENFALRCVYNPVVIQ